MKKKIYKNILGLAVFTILLISGIFVYFYNQSIHQTIRDQIRTEAMCAAAGLEVSGNNLEYLEQLKGEDTLRFTLINPSGVVLYDSNVNASRMENHLDRPEVQAALIKGAGSEIRLSDTLKTETYYYAIRLSDGGVLRLAKEVSSNLQLFLELLPMLLVVALLILLCSYMVAHMLAVGIAKRVNQIDLYQPMSDMAYKELEPLLNRIESQNGQIEDQMMNLLEQEEKFTTITRNMSEGLLLLDLQSKILFINQSCKDLFDLSTMKFEGKHISAFNRSEQLQETVHMALLGESYSSMLRLAEKQVQFFGNPVRENGSITGAVIFVMDVTSNQKAQQMRKEFSANVSHELKTPLTSISGYAELMHNGMVQAQDVPVFAGKIYEEAQRLLTLVNDIIKISQLDEKDSRMEKEMVDLYRLTEEIQTRLIPAAEKNKVQMCLEGGHVELYAARQMMYDLIYNLCENGIKYNKEGGTVSVHLYEAEDHAVIRVTDTGIGIPMEYQERIFERFYRIDKSHSKQTGGTGLGLSIVKHVVEYQGGYIEIHSEQGEGTTIGIHLQE